MTTKDTTQRQSMHTRTRSEERRGVATILVVIAMGSAVVLSASYLSSRRNSEEIGANAERAAQARWVANSASELTMAILETDNNFFDGVDTTLIENMVMGDGVFSVWLTNLLGQAPSNTDVDIVMTAIASIDGVTHRTQSIVNRPSSADPAEALDPHLREFAILTKSRLCIDGTSTVRLWGASPAARAGRLTKIGAAFSASSNLQIASTAKLYNAGLYVPSWASAALKGRIGATPFAGGMEIAMPLPARPERLPPGVAALTQFDMNDRTISGPTADLLGNYRYQAMTVQNPGATLLLKETNGRNYSFDTLTVQNDGKIVVEGNVRLEVRGDFTLKSRSAIHLANPDSTLTLYVRGATLIDDAVIGFDPAAAATVNRTIADVNSPYRPSRKIRIVTVRTQDGGLEGDLHIVNKSMVRGVVYAPVNHVKIDNDSAVFGRITARTAELKNRSAVIYDPALDLGVGLTEPTSPVYDPIGDPLPELADMLTALPADATADDIEAQLLAMRGTLVSPSNTPGNGASARFEALASGEVYPELALKMEGRHRNAPWIDATDAFDINTTPTPAPAPAGGPDCDALSADTNLNLDGDGEIDPAVMADLIECGIEINN